MEFLHFLNCKIRLKISYQLITEKSHMVLTYFSTSAVIAVVVVVVVVVVLAMEKFCFFAPLYSI